MPSQVAITLRVLEEKYFELRRVAEVERIPGGRLSVGRVINSMIEEGLARRKVLPAAQTAEGLSGQGAITEKG